MKMHNKLPAMRSLAGLPSLTALAALLILGSAAVSRADLIDYQDDATGKHRHFPVASFTHGGAKYTKSGSLEVFELQNRTPRRIEHRIEPHYNSGKHTFEGEVKIDQASATTIFQVFNARRPGPTMFLQASGGTIKRYGGGVVVASGIQGKWTRIKVVHDLPGNKLQVFINGALKNSGGAGGSFSGDMKYGTYGGTSRPVKVSWRNVRVQHQ